MGEKKREERKYKKEKRSDKRALGNEE